MSIAARDKIARFLAGGVEAVPSPRSASLALPAEVLDLHVDGFGDIPLPVPAPVAKKLAAVTIPARFGQGEETLLDVSVRDTGEIAPERVQITGDRWASSLAGALEELGTRLGVRGPERLRAELHSMLVYGKGQFFAAHQDSEKHDDMVATLVVMLPSDHSGGELVLLDGEAAAAYTGSSTDLVLVAFY
ncbi:MAG: 2OG-Fe(II) oxygenase, partial [Actinomycetia bacterium]|nr:2OG-Fe(II) oxygenase [Actinomycetes bacterium]